MAAPPDGVNGERRRDFTERHRAQLFLPRPVARQLRAVNQPRVPPWDLAPRPTRALKAAQPACEPGPSRPQTRGVSEALMPGRPMRAAQCRFLELHSRQEPPISRKPFV